MSEQQPLETPTTSVTTHEGAPGQAAGDAAPPESTSSAPARRGLRRRRGSGPPRTRISAAWVGALAGLLVLVLLLIFILENTETVTINFLGASGRLGLGLALLVAAVAGGLIVAILGVARIAQLRKLGKR